MALLSPSVRALSSDLHELDELQDENYNSENEIKQFSSRKIMARRNSLDFGVFESEKMQEISQISHREFPSTPNRLLGGRRNSMSTLLLTPKSSCSSSFFNTRKKQQRLKPSSSFKKLIKKELEVHHQKYEGLATKIVELSEQHILKAKDKNLRKVIHIMSSFVFVVFLGILMYCNYIMLAPHFNAVLMAALISLVLNSINEQLIVLIQQYKSKLFVGFRKRYVVFGFLVAFTAIATRMFWILIGIIVLNLVVFFFEPKTSSATVLTLLVLCMICFPLLVALKQSANEVEIATKYLFNLMEDDDALEKMIENILNNQFYQKFQSNTFTYLGEEFYFLNDLDCNSTKIKNKLRTVAAFAGENLQYLSVDVVRFVSSIGNVLYTFATFATTLYYLLRSDSPWEFLNNISPLSPSENIELYQSMKLSTGCILTCSVCVAFVHWFCMYVVLYLSDFEIVAIPSFACAIVAVVPFTGTYVVSLPVSIFLWAKGMVLSSVIVGFVDLTLVLFVDAKIQSFIPGDSHFVGLSIVAGLFSFGSLGILYGPLLVGLTTCVIKIYLEYLKKPLDQDMFSPVPSTSQRKKL